jgi:hypothetical protein
MAKKQHIIVGVHITDRVRHVGDVQSTLTEYGCSIKTRLGLHEASEDFCSTSGLLLLEMACDTTLADELATKLNAIEGIETQQMVFDHPEDFAK